MPLISGKLLVGMGMGVAAARVARQVAPNFRGLGRPLAKAAVKSALMLIDEGKQQFARMTEQVADLAAEVRAEQGSPTSSPRPAHPAAPNRPEIARDASYTA